MTERLNLPGDPITITERANLANDLRNALQILCSTAVRIVPDAPADIPVPRHSIPTAMLRAAEHRIEHVVAELERGAEIAARFAAVRPSSGAVRRGTPVPDVDNNLVVPTETLTEHLRNALMIGEHRLASLDTEEQTVLVQSCADDLRAVVRRLSAALEIAENRKAHIREVNDTVTRLFADCRL
jgi:hypothetical protein